MSLLPTNAEVSSQGSQFNAVDFQISQRMAAINTSLPVKIVAVHGGGITAPCFVDVQPLVNQLDGNGASIPHGVVYNLPVWRLQGGTSAFILDPVAGDIGTALFCHRDISAVKATKAQANPGSRRKFSLSDGIYLGGILNGAPTQYVLMAGGSVQIASASTATSQNLLAGNGASGTFATAGGVVVTVHDGIITNIY